METYNRFQDNYNYLAGITPLQVLQVPGRSCFLGLALLRNIQAEPHKDVSMQMMDGLRCVAKETLKEKSW